LTGEEISSGFSVEFERGISVSIMGIDGTWRRECTMEEVSESGAKLQIESSIKGLPLKEFFLILSSTGLAFRRCEIGWINGDHIGAKFVKQVADKKKHRRPRTAAEA